jgi:proliferating cell nuclear antigen
LNQLDSGNENDSVALDVDEPVSLSFASRYLNLFSKAGCLASQVQLNMSNDTPLMVVYKIMNGMGDIKYYLAPKITE